ncbi:MAG: methyltransferase domain-containing protein, partial [Blastocatellia bacterium]|nr:methyltransferase domain-containing protein [Blastocatellia bacterium]
GSRGAGEQRSGGAGERRSTPAPPLPCSPAGLNPVASEYTKTVTVASAGRRVLDIGCGTNKIPGAIGMDINPRTDADVIHDLDDLPYPFDDDEFDEVIGRHVIEHVRDPMAVMSELHRITRHGGLVRLVAPHWTNPDWASDLTHRNHLSSYSFRNLTDERAVYPFYTHVRFRQRAAYVTMLKIWKWMGFEFFVNLDHRFPRLRFFRQIWEHYLNFIARGKEIHFELEVVKKSWGAEEKDEG